MKDYSAMSDFEINKAVGNLTGDATSAEPVLGLVIRNANGIKFDPCNSWADAGPIIEKNKIKIQVVKRVRDYNERYEVWEASVNSPHFEEECTNPLRAAMVVFLMMKENENA